VVCPKCSEISAKLHGVTSQKSVTAVKSSSFPSHYMTHNQKQCCLMDKLNALIMELLKKRPTSKCSS